MYFKNSFLFTVVLATATVHADLGPDSDGDGIADAYDVFPDDPTEWMDTDEDGIGNFADEDNPTGYCQTGYCVANEAGYFHYYRLRDETLSVPLEFIWDGDRIVRNISGSEGSAMDVETNLGQYTLFDETTSDSTDDVQNAILSSRGRWSINISDSSTRNTDFALMMNLESGARLFEWDRITRPRAYLGYLALFRFDWGYGDVNDFEASTDSVVVLIPNHVNEPAQSRDDIYSASWSLENLHPLLDGDGPLFAWPDKPISSSPEGGYGYADWRLIGEDNWLRVTSETPPGTHELILTILDGKGGKVETPLTVHVLAQRTERGHVFWGGSLADYDGDGTPNATDSSPLGGYGSVDPDDSDLDTVPNDDDNCPTIANEDQADNDSDGEGDVCDSDDDNDGVSDEEDAFPLDDAESLDTDGDGIGNNADTDDDGDGVSDEDDDFPLDVSESVDTDGDGIGNNTDTDDDNDGYSDADESLAGTDPLDADSYPTETSAESEGLPIWMLYLASQLAADDDEQNPPDVEESLEPPSVGKCDEDIFGRVDCDELSSLSLPYSSSGSQTISQLPRPAYFTFGTFVISAESGSYRVSELVAEDSNGAVSPEIHNLVEGQTLAKGETVTIELRTPPTQGQQAELRYFISFEGESGEACNNCTFTLKRVFTSN